MSQKILDLGHEVNLNWVSSHTGQANNEVIARLIYAYVYDEYLGNEDVNALPPYDNDDAYGVSYHPMENHVCVGNVHHEYGYGCVPVVREYVHAHVVL
ncbi:hypothetical protein ACTAZI_01460 [Legionella bozemanae]|uniref:hypothetical protein n=1 Tax=Legionella bozemanae TaxID=447 RepID=UPI003EEF2AE8